ncbi:MAG: hypothetical protein A2X49_07865 [Lentisphaerae bacterium GWF2_52_8]|nr:MAG: hypothetical protein A2X49_07865 [Lentisphaerae bacterium GWF2_52_8]
MVPDLAIVDPLLTLSVPPSVTASSGMDAMVQAIEAYTSVSANAVTQALSEKSVELLLNRLPDAFHNGADIGARTAVAEGSLLSAMSFSQSGLGAAHGLAHPIGSILGLPHGLVCSVLIMHVLEWNSLSCGGLYDSLAHKCGLADRSELIAKISGISAEMGIPGSFAGHRIDEAQKQFIIKNCRSRSMQTNPRPMSDDDIASIIDRLFS